MHPAPPAFPWFYKLFAALLLAATAATFSTGCSESESEAPESSAQVDRYTVRGVLVSLPRPDEPNSSLLVHHEAIPDFRDAQGSVVGMDEMTMGFPPAEGLDLDGFAVGDKVEVTFEVDWSPTRRGYRATDLKQLADDLPLDFKAAPADADDAEAHHGHDHHGHGHEHP
jgi:Cu/Ag efflux protein CusF